MKCLFLGFLWQWEQGEICDAPYKNSTYVLWCQGNETAVLSNQGTLLAQLDDSHEGIIIYDTETESFIKEYAPIPK